MDEKTRKKYNARNKNINQQFYAGFAYTLKKLQYAPAKTKVASEVSSVRPSEGKRERQKETVLILTRRETKMES